MDEAARKVIVRACARFKTGIRKAFLIDGRKFVVEGDVAGFEEGVIACLTEWKGDPGVPGGLSHCGLKEVTPEAVYKAMMELLVDEMHAL